jgi:deazaflavin-dependent oxidoreductase (nitroreductase family)
LTRTQYRPFHALIQKLAASPPGSWLLAHILRYADRFVVWLSGGRTSLTSMLAGVPVVMVTTTGARSGQPRTSPLLPICDPAGEDRFALIASNWGQHHLPSWYFNLKKNPRATVAQIKQASTYVAREAAGEEYDRFWRYAVDTYFGYGLYKQRAGRRIPIMIMERE